MDDYMIKIDAAKEPQARVTVGELKHEHRFSWMPASTLTNGKYDSYSVPAEEPVNKRLF